MCNERGGGARSDRRVESPLEHPSSVARVIYKLTYTRITRKTFITLL